MSQIKLSICIPNYNRFDELVSLVDKLKAQTVVPYEVIIQDNASTSGNVLDVLKDLPSNFKVFINPTNIGMMPNVNSCMQRATGDYICIVHNDDFVASVYVETILSFIEKYPGFNIYTTNEIGIDKNNEIFGEFRLYQKDTLLKKKQGIRRLWQHMYFTIFSITGATVYSAEYLQNNEFDTSLGNEADLDNSLKSLATEDIMYVDVPIYFARVNSNNVSSNNKSSRDRLSFYINNCLDIYKKHMGSYDHIPFYMEKLYGMYFVQLLLKYHVRPDHAYKILGITSFYVKILIPFMSLMYCLHLVLRKIRLQFNKTVIERYL